MIDLSNLQGLFLTLTTLAVGGISIGALDSLLVNAIKDFMDKKYHPVLPYIVGIILGLLIFQVPSLSYIGWDIIAGLFIGALATGGYRYVNPTETTP